MKTILILVLAPMLLFTGCASTSSEREVVVDTKTPPHATGAVPGSGNASRMSAPILSGD